MAENFPLIGALSIKLTMPFRVTDRLSDSDRAALMGGTLARVYQWSPSKA
jgi:hypothetical protein